MTWPSGEVAENYPVYHVQKQLVPEVDEPVINLIGMTDEQAMFVLLMCVGWKRQSRFRLDFSLPRLTARLRYRSDDGRKMKEVEGWYGAGAEADRQPPAMMSADQAFQAMETYVRKNKLLTQMSVARGLVFRAYCQYLPTTLDGAVWLQNEWTVTMPKFHAIRGRFVWLTEGISTLATRRGKSEGAYFAASL
jgi:hypothetical protein